MDLPGLFLVVEKQMQLFFQPDIVSGNLFLNEEESRHCVKVLRKREGDEINIVDGQGGIYLATIEKADAKKCSFAIKETTIHQGRSYYIHVAIAPTKNADRIEWFVEKAIELGIDKITFVDCENSERAKVNIERLQKKAVSAMKQSLNPWLPQLSPIHNFKSFCSTSEAEQKFIAYVDEKIPTHLKNAALPDKHYLILIGPEGDFSQKEIELAMENGFEPVSLGKSRLRTETAGLAACHICNLVNE